MLNRRATIHIVTSSRKKKTTPRASFAPMTARASWMRRRRCTGGEAAAALGAGALLWLLAAAVAVDARCPLGFDSGERPILDGVPAGRHLQQKQTAAAPAAKGVTDPAGAAPDLSGAGEVMFGNSGVPIDYDDATNSLTAGVDGPTVLAVRFVLCCRVVGHPLRPSATCECVHARSHLNITPTHTHTHTHTPHTGLPPCRKDRQFRPRAHSRARRARARRQRARLL